MAFAARGLVLAVLVLLALPGQAAARPAGKLVPAEGALLGVYLDGWGSNPYANVTDFEGVIGRQLDIDHRYWAWGDGWPYFGAEPYHYERWDVENGRIPLLSWDYVGAGNLDAILSGKHDALIRSRAAKAAQFGQPFFLRWGYEMNGFWMPWSGAQNGKDPAKYVAAWRYLHDMFVAEGATNVVWVWAPNSHDNPTEAWNHFMNYYPGDDYVDWVGIDGYNWGTSESWSKWDSFGTIFGRVYSAFKDRKPIMIAEVGSSEQGGSKAQWLLETRAAIQTGFPSIAAFVYFNHNHGGDWELTTSAAAMDAFRNLAADPYFNPAGMPPGLEPSPLPPLSGKVKVRGKSGRRQDLRRTTFLLGGQQLCSARRAPYSCSVDTSPGKHSFQVNVVTRTRATRSIRFRVALRGYETGAVVFRFSRRVACVDRHAPYTCLVSVPAGKRKLRIVFKAQTEVARATLVRVTH